MDHIDDKELYENFKFFVNSTYKDEIIKAFSEIENKKQLLSSFDSLYEANQDVAERFISEFLQGGPGPNLPKEKQIKVLQYISKIDLQKLQKLSEICRHLERSRMVVDTLSYMTEDDAIKTIDLLTMEDKNNNSKAYRFAYSIFELQLEYDIDNIAKFLTILIQYAQSDARQFLYVLGDLNVHEGRKSLYKFFRGLIYRDHSMIQNIINLMIHLEYHNAKKLGEIFEAEDQSFQIFGHIVDTSLGLKILNKLFSLKNYWHTVYFLNNKISLHSDSFNFYEDRQPYVKDTQEETKEILKMYVEALPAEKQPDDGTRKIIETYYPKD